MNLLEVFSHSENLTDVPEGEVLFEEGEPGDHMYVIVEGEIALSLRNKTLDIARAGDIVGEMALLNMGDRSATATVLSDCLLEAIDLHSFKALVQHTPDFALHVMNVLAERLRRADEIIAG